MNTLILHCKASCVREVSIYRVSGLKVDFVTVRAVSVSAVWKGLASNITTVKWFFTLPPFVAVCFRL